MSNHRMTIRPEPRSDLLIIAAGQGMRVPSPIPMQPISRLVLTLARPLKHPLLLHQTCIPQAPGGTAIGNVFAPNSGTIEYDEALAPRLTSPGFPLAGPE